MTQRTIIVHPHDGIYIGSFLGLGFWSAIDCAGQVSAVTFPTESDARDYVRTWENGNDPADYTYHTIDAAEQWATTDELDRAGLSAWTGPLKAQQAVA